MNKSFEKILKKIEEKRNKYQRFADGSNFDGWNEEDIKYSAKAEMCEELKEIVHEVAEEYHGGWIPCSERLPKYGEVVMCSCSNGGITISCITHKGVKQSKVVRFGSHNVIAWQPLPEPFKERD